MRRATFFVVLVGLSGIARGDALQERFDRGQDLFVQKDFAAAAAEFRAAYAVRPLAALIFNEAVCYEKMRDYRKAVTLFKRYLVENPEARDRVLVEQRIRVLDDEAGRTDLPQPPLKVPFLIETEPPGATVYLDDQNNPPLGATPWSGGVDRGTHTFIVVAGGYKTLTREIDVREKTLNRLILALQRDNDLGFVNVRANIQHADVYIDDVRSGTVGRTPYLNQIPPGRHTITVNKLGFTEEVRAVDIKPGEAVKIVASLDKAPIGFIHVDGATLDGALVKLDGRTVCERAPCHIRTTSGMHSLTVEKKGHKTLHKNLSVADATETTLAVRLAPRPARTDLIWKFGLAAAFLGGGVALGVKARGIEDDLQHEIEMGGPPLPPSDDRFGKGKIYAYAADGMLLVGGIGAAVAVWSALSEQGPRSEGRERVNELSVAPAVAPGYAGLAAQLTF